MTAKKTTHGKGGVFYGWYALGGAMLVIFIVGGAFVSSFGVLLPVITSEFGWSRGIVALALSMGILAFGLPSPFYGSMVSKYGPRFTMITGNLLAGLGIAGVSLVQDAWHVYLLYIIIGAGGGFGGYIASTTLTNNWFVRRRSLALGMFMACAGLGGFVFPPVTTSLIEAIGWRMTWVVLGGSVLILPVLIGSVIMVRNRPEEMGLMPDGVPADPYVGEEMRGASLTGKEDSSWNARQVLKQPTAWLIGAFSASNAFTMGTMMTHQIAYFRDIGFNPMTAATVMSVMSAFSLTGSLGFGALAMKFRVRYLACVAFGIQLMGLVILLNTRELGLLYVFAAFQGFSNGSLITALPTFVGAYYPRERYARVLGVVFPFQVVMNAFSATIAGTVYDAAGTYTPAFIAAAIFSMAGLLFVFMARPPKQQ